MLDIVLLGINHKTAPIELRECLAFSNEDSKAALHELSQMPPIKEALLFSTCNRVEVLFVTANKSCAIDTTKNFLADFNRISLAQFESALYIHEGDAAIRHIFRVDPNGSRQPKVLKRLIILCAIVVAGAAFATDGTPADNDALARWEADRATIFDASEIELDTFKWIARPVVVFADTPADPAFKRQVELLDARIDELIERDVVLITDTDPSAMSALRTKLRPRGFMLTLIGKDGRVNLRKPRPWDVRELTRSIDKMPLRLQEIRERQ